MNIIGVSLELPSKNGFISVILTTLTLSFILGFFYMMNGIKLDNLLSGVAGALAGSFASACGASIQKHGWRGVAITVAFGVVVMVLVSAIHAAFSS
jgi:hypothetical protein